MLQLSKNSRVCVVGVGGVGSHAAVALARAGLGPLLRLVDFDQVTLSSLNRHACATLADVGIPKVTCVQQHIRKICPHDEYLHVDARVELFDAASADRLLALPDNQQWDIIVDAIDDVPTKAQLIQYCLQHKIPVVSCMGAGGKADVTRLHVGRELLVHLGGADGVLGEVVASVVPDEGVTGDDGIVLAITIEIGEGFG